MTSTAKSRFELNANTVLLTLVLALSGWTLKKVSDIGEKQAQMGAQIQNLERIVYNTDIANRRALQ